MNRGLLLSLAVGALLSLAVQSCFAAIQITSVNRGVSVDGEVSANSTVGEFNTSLFSDFDFGTVAAEIESMIDASQFRLDGFAYEAADFDGPLNSVEASIFFEVAFTLDAPFTFTLGGVLVGITESEHYFLRSTLVGPGVDLTYDVWNGFQLLNESGNLSPGNYAFSLFAHPSVLGGLDGGQAEVYLSNVVLSLVPGIVPGGNNVPESGTMVACSLFCLCGSAVFGRRGLRTTEDLRGPKILDKLRYPTNRRATSTALAASGA